MALWARMNPGRKYSIHTVCAHIYNSGRFMRIYFRVGCGVYSVHDKNYKVLGKNILPKPNMSGCTYTLGGHSLYRMLPVFIQALLQSILYFAWEDQSEKVCCIVQKVVINCITILYELQGAVMRLIGQKQHCYTLN